MTNNLIFILLSALASAGFCGYALFTCLRLALAYRQRDSEREAAETERE